MWDIWLAKTPLFGTGSRYPAGKIVATSRWKSWPTLTGLYDFSRTRPETLTINQSIDLLRIGRCETLIKHAQEIDSTVDFGCYAFPYKIYLLRSLSTAAHAQFLFHINFEQLRIRRKSILLLSVLLYVVLNLPISLPSMVTVPIGFSLEEIQLLFIISLRFILFDKINFSNIALPHICNLKLTLIVLR